VPIPFRDADDLEELGTAAFLKIEPSARDSVYLGALFVVNARGEPIEFAYNLIETPHSFLWRPADLRRHAERKLTASLLDTCEAAPRLVLCLADEVGGELFGRDIEVSVPVGRIDRSLQAAPAGAEVREVPDLPEPVHLFWYPAPPTPGSAERRLFDQLSGQGLLLEPFERAAFGLREVYGPKEDTQ
jgi:hypothetical protein